MRKAAQLLAPTAASVTDATLITSASTDVTIIRTIVVCNTTNAAVTFNLAIGGTAATAANCLYNLSPLAAQATTVLYGPFVLPPSGTLHGLASVTGVTFSASGETSSAGG